MYPAQSLYSRLSTGEKYEDNLSETGSSSNASQSLKRQRRGPGLLLILNALMMTISIISLTVSAVNLQRSRLNHRNPNYRNDMNAVLKETSFYSPILDHYPLPLETKFINNTIFEPSIFRQFPSPDVDAAWSEVASFGLTYITPSDVEKLGKDPALTVHHPDNPDAHLAIVSVNHQIHCLNDLRQNLHPDYYYPTGFHSPLHWEHVYHCLHLILQTLQCNADVGIITYNWMESQENPIPDFSYDMMCRDFDGLRKWQDETMMPVESMRWTRQGGEKEVSAWPRLVELNEEEERQKAKGKDEGNTQRARGKEDAGMVDERDV